MTRGSIPIQCQDSRPVQEQTSLVTSEHPNLGVMRNVLQQVNPLDAQLPGAFGQSRSYRNLRLKEWQHFAVSTPELYVAMALFDAKLSALVQLVVLEKASNRVQVFEKNIPSRSCHIPETLWDAEARYEGTDIQMRFRNWLARDRHLLTFAIPAGKHNQACHATIEVHAGENVSQPMVVALPLGKADAHGRTRFMYSHKAVAPASGSLTLHDKEYQIVPERDYALIDIHKGYYPRVMRWNWATAGSIDSSGRACGFNLTDNQVLDQANYNENCIWHAGQVHMLPPVTFDVPASRQDALAPWRIRDKEGRVDLVCHPQAERNLRKNWIVLQNNYWSPFGRFTGTIQLENGASIQVQDWYGMCEDMYLKA